jgi:hypothetical protein
MKNVIELYKSPVKDRNEDKYGHLSSEQCICCMKPIKDVTSAFAVHMNTDWMVVHPSISEDLCAAETGADSQGCFDVGPECAKKMKGFTTKNSVK